MQLAQNKRIEIDDHSINAQQAGKTTGPGILLLHESISDSKLVIFAGASHPYTFEQPQLWHQTLLNFAKTIVPRI